MLFEKITRQFDLKVGDRLLSTCCREELLADGIRCTLDHLEVTSHMTILEGGKAAHWLQTLENTGDHATPILSEIHDCDLFFELRPDTPPANGFLPDRSVASIVVHGGSDCTKNEWMPTEYPIFAGQRQVWSNAGGRSSQGITPFFRVKQGNRGLLIGIGWSGQWQATFERDEHGIRITAGIQDARFFMTPHEKLRTCSMLIVSYDEEEGEEVGINRFRRVMREHICRHGKDGNPAYGPITYGIWGGMHSEEILKRNAKIAEDQLGFECCWIDAGWFGDSELECPDEFVGNWPIFTGDWHVNRRYHPNELTDVAADLKEKGIGLLLWIEPQRAYVATQTPKEHPERYLSCDENPDNYLLNLGNPEACDFAIETVSHYIRTLGLSVYREDFNIDPLPYWRRHDTEGRRGITEIYHIMGFYRFWDTLLERFPGLIIDNCASGGRKIDIETMARAMPLWRSDAQCNWNREAEVAQCHASAINCFIPYSGTCVGDAKYDLYKWRSSVGASLRNAFWMYEGREYENEDVETLRRYIAEYKRVRPLTSKDYYSLIPISRSDSDWSAWQFEDAEAGKGVLIFLRRTASPFDCLTVDPRGLCKQAEWESENGDTGERILHKAGEKLTVTLPEPRSSALFFYSKI